MAKFRTPSFQQRASSAAKAKQAAIDKLLNRPIPDDAQAREKSAVREAREAEKAKKRAEKRAAWEEERAARKARVQERRDLEAMVPVLTDAERKAALSARYRSRRGRGSGYVALGYEDVRVLDLAPGQRPPERGGDPQQDRQGAGARAILDAAAPGVPRVASGALL
jgi:membrane protein involved in colicin uptake